MGHVVSVFRFDQHSLEHLSNTLQVLPNQLGLLFRLLPRAGKLEQVVDHFQELLVRYLAELDEVEQVECDRSVKFANVGIQVIVLAG